MNTILLGVSKGVAGVFGVFFKLLLPRLRLELLLDSLELDRGVGEGLSSLPFEPATRVESWAKSLLVELEEQESWRCFSVASMRMVDDCCAVSMVPTHSRQAQYDLCPYSTQSKHPLQKILPHHRQWCRRVSVVKVRAQL